MPNVPNSVVIGLSAILAGVIAFLTLTPLVTPPPGGFERSDLVYHLVAFGSLTLPVAVYRPSWLWLAVPLFVAYGGAIEIIQPYVNRQRHILDFAANCCGVLLAVALVAPLARRYLLRSAVGD